MGGTEEDVVPLHPPFDVCFRGFHRRQVLDHIESLEGRVALVAADRDDALEQAADLRKLLDHLRREAEESRVRLERMQAAPHAVAAVSERLHHIMVLAQDETAELRERAEAEARQLREDAEREAAELRAQCATELAEHEQRLRREGEELRRAREEAVSQRRALIAEGRAEADRLVREAADGCRRLEAESEAHRTQVQQELEATIARRQAEVDAALRRQETLSAARIELLLRMVGDEIRRRTGLLDRRTAELEELQLNVAGQLAVAHTALVDAVGQVQRPAATGRGSIELGGNPTRSDQLRATH